MIRHPAQSWRGKSYSFQDPEKMSCLHRKSPIPSPYSPTEFKPLPFNHLAFYKDSSVLHDTNNESASINTPYLTNTNSVLHGSSLTQTNRMNPSACMPSSSINKYSPVLALEPLMTLDDPEAVSLIKKVKALRREKDEVYQQIRKCHESQQPTDQQQRQLHQQRQQELLDSLQGLKKHLEEQSRKLHTQVNQA